MILRVALRYLFARKSHKVVNVISVISMAGVAVATMAIVVVLSVFNGFSDLARRHLSAIDPDIKIVPVAGKTLSGDSIAAAVEALPEVAAATPVLAERALMVAGDKQKAVIVKGVDPHRAPLITDFDAMLIDGVYLGSVDSIAAFQIAVAVAMETGLRPSPYAFADVYMPRRTGRINPANPAGAYRRMPGVVSGVFSVDQPEYDGEYVFAPLDDVRRLLEYDGGEASAVEVRLAPGVSSAHGVRAVAKALADNAVDVLDRERQQADTFRMIAVEKWITFAMLVFILLIASFNIISTLSLIVIEKRSDTATLRALGATRRTVARIFVAEGWLITSIGGLAGTIVGVALALVQQYFGIIKLGGDPSALSISVYPVHVEVTDVVMVLATVLVTGLVISQISRIFTRKIE